MLFCNNVSSDNETSSWILEHTFGQLCKSCDFSNFPPWVCFLANCAGLVSTTIWFLVLLPQLLKNFRRRSVEGISLAWAIMNFTAAFNNCFFVFKLNFRMPLYTKINAVYMPILEFLFLLQFVAYSKITAKKIAVYVTCSIIWVLLAILQFTLPVYGYLEWVSVTLWSTETFPQVFLNVKRRSTEGLAVGSVALATIGKCTDFVTTYLLIMPLQYVTMCYFSSTVAFIVSLQMVFYWNRKPITDQQPGSEIDRNCGPYNDSTITNKAQNNNSTFCNVIRSTLSVIFLVALVIFIVGLCWRTESSFWALVAPTGTSLIILTAYIYYYCCPSLLVSAKKDYPVTWQ